MESGRSVWCVQHGVTGRRSLEGGGSSPGAGRMSPQAEKWGKSWMVGVGGVWRDRGMEAAVRASLSSGLEAGDRKRWGGWGRQGLTGAGVGRHALGRAGGGVGGRSEI